MNRSSSHLVVKSISCWQIQVNLKLSNKSLWSLQEVLNENTIHFLFSSFQTCQITLLDDNYDPRVEGEEKFEVFLSSAVGSSLAEPVSALVTIDDKQLDSKYQFQ